MLIAVAAIVGWIVGVFAGSYLYFRIANVVIEPEESFDWVFWIGGSGGSILSVGLVIILWLQAGNNENE